MGLQSTSSSPSSSALAALLDGAFLSSSAGGSVPSVPRIAARFTAPLSADIPHDVDDRQRYIVLTCAIAPVFSIIFVTLRLYARRCIMPRRLQFEDWVAAATLLFCISYSVLLSIWTANGGGLHMDDLVRLGLEDRYYKWLLIASPSYIVACLGYKSAILILYLRLFMAQRATIIVTRITLFITVGYLLANLLTQIFGCHPIQEFWAKYDPASVPGGVCIDFVASDIGFGSLNVITDFAIFVIPLPAVWMSGFARNEKLGVSLVFATGALAFAVALVRFQFAIRDLTGADRTFIAGDTMLWMVLEINTGLVCSCTPALKPLWRKLFAPQALARFAPPAPGHKRGLSDTIGGKASGHGPRDPFGMPTFDDGDDYDAYDEKTEQTEEAAGSDGKLSRAKSFLARAKKGLKSPMMHHTFERTRRFSERSISRIKGWQVDGFDVALGDDKARRNSMPSTIAEDDDRFSNLSRLSTASTYVGADEKGKAWEKTDSPV